MTPSIHQLLVHQWIIRSFHAPSLAQGTQRDKRAANREWKRKRGTTVTVVDDSDHVGWLASATRIGEVYMDDPNSMVENVLGAEDRSPFLNQ